MTAVPSADQVGEHDWIPESTVLACVVGSRAWGLATAESDTDTRGVFLALTRSFWGLRKPPTHVEGPEPEWFRWEVEWCVKLALKANPTVLEMLYSPMVVRADDVGQELLALRSAFLSRRVHATFSGYTQTQFARIDSGGEPRSARGWAHAMHLLRLLTEAVELVRSGLLEVDMAPVREELLAVRRGELSWPQVQAWRARLHAALDEVLPESPLPALPDVARVDHWLRSVRERDLAGGGS